ncbi:Ig-like domain-containing protein, partial [Patiriisocius hiemis]
MKLFTQSTKNSFLFFLTTFLFFLSPLLVFGQATPSFPNTQTLISAPGTANQPGAIYLVEDVEIAANGTPTDVDALIYIVSFIGTPTVVNVDTTQDNVNRFEPSITYDSAGEGVQFRIVFIVAGTADTDVNDAVIYPLDAFALEIIDNDAEEWAEVVIPDSYTLESATPPGTIITPNPGSFYPAGSGAIRFNSANITDPGVDPASTRSIVVVNYTNVSEVNFVLGRDNNDPVQTRNISIGFLGEVTFGTPSTTTINNPPTVVNQSTTTAFNTATASVPLLNGATDPENNIDPTTITLIDPNDPTNVGSPGTPLVIPGEGTYVVDNAGNVVFTPVNGFTGVSTINFRVEDAIGAGSNLGTFTVTVADPIADVGVTKTLTDTSPYQTGDTVIYTLVVSNAGPDTANNVVVTDTPSNLTIQTISAPCAGGFPCTIPSIASG